MAELERMNCCCLAAGEPAGSAAASPVKRKTCPGPVNWRNIVATTCLWLACGLCNAAFSLMGPFFPEEVCSQL